ncbi:MAG: enoyl-CoA hydratase-related protein, partial [Castellaniella sp.]|uniref:enoyl-CoA hydratase-related protein n=1 Tax=Castellaniella sp. TaxID=1955812 RepID=UPI003C74778E
MTYQNIDFSIDQGIARLTLARPDKLNSFTEAMHLEVRDALDQVQRDATARVLVLTGAGRGFCAGQDLGDRAMQINAGQTPDLGATVEGFYKPLILTLQNLRVPTLAAVRGIAACAGASIA